MVIQNDARLVVAKNRRGDETDVTGECLADFLKHGEIEVRQADFTDIMSWPSHS